MYPRLYGIAVGVVGYHTYTYKQKEKQSGVPGKSEREIPCLTIQFRKQELLHVASVCVDIIA